MLQVLTDCAKDHNVEDFVVESVVCLTKEVNPCTKSWKVAVPTRLKEVMSSGAMYPRGWSYRVFHQGP